MSTRVNLGGFDRMNRTMDQNFAKMGNAFERTQKTFDHNFAKTQKKFDRNFAKSQNAFTERQDTFDRDFARGQNDVDRDFADVASSSRKLVKSSLNIVSRPFRGVAIGTGIPAIGFLVALIAISILFPVVSLAFIIGASITTAALLALGITAIVYGAKTAQINQAGKLALKLNISE